MTYDKSNPSGIHEKKAFLGKLRTDSALLEQDAVQWLIHECEKAWVIQEEQAAHINKLIAVLEYYAGMKAVCVHDDSSWCNHCPDAGKRARQALSDIKDIPTESESISKRNQGAE